MKRFAIFGVMIVYAALTVDCNGGGGKKEDMASKQDLAALESRLATSINRKIKPIDAMAKKLDRDWTDTLRDLPRLQLKLGKIEKEVTRWEKLRDEIKKAQGEMDKKVAGARSDMRKILEAEEKLLVERLTSLREVLKELREAGDGN